MAHPDGVTVSGEDSEVERLRCRVDELAQQLLGTRDAALGAEAELGVARARIAELEHQVHVGTVEIEELRAVVDAADRAGTAPATALALQARLARRARRLARAVGA